MKKLKIGKSDIHGKGLFSGEPIRKGELIAKVHSGIQLDPETVKYMPTQFGRFYNHDEQKFNTRNEVIGNHRYLRALKNIPANAELTANYREHPEMEQPENFDQGKYASFDFDKTIATDEGLAKARQMLKDGYNLFIVSARDKVTPDMVARARKAGIPEENIIATGSDEAKVRKVKQLGVEKHFDDKPEVIAALGLVGEQFKKGGGVNSKRYTKSLTGTNKLFTKNNLFKKKSTKRIYDPNAKYFDNGGETTVESEVECTDDGRCYETDQIQNMLDRGRDIPREVLDNAWNVVDRKGISAVTAWKKLGVPTLASRLGMTNPLNCMWAAGSGWMCEPEFSNVPKTAFESNDKFINAVNKSTIPFERVTKTTDSNFDSKSKGLLQPGDIINIKGPYTSHAMTFSHYREDGMPIHVDSNGMDVDFDWKAGVWSGMKPGNGRTAYVSRFNPEMLFGDKIKELEEKARTNPTYYKTGGALLTKKVTCKKCGWEWDAADGGNDITTCHKCGGKGLIHAQKGGGLNEFAGGGPIDCGEGYEWNEELQQCVEYTSKYNQQSLAKHLAEKKIYEDALKEIEAGTAEYAILEEAYNTKVKKLEKEKARVLKVRGNVIPASQNLDLADNKINPRDPLYQNFLNASNPKELELARKALPQEIKNVLPNQGSYNVAKWNSKTNKWKDGSYPGRELYCTPYGCFAYQKAGASDVPIIGGNIDFANRAATGNFAFEKINPNERQLGDMALMVENAPNDYTDRNSGRSRRPHHTTIYAGPDTNAPKDSEKGYFYNADDGIRLNFKKSYLATDETPGDRFDYYRYVGAQNKINDEILDLAKQKEEFNIKQEQRKNNVALPSMATLEPKLITQNNTATLQYPKKEEILKPKNKKLFKKKSFKYGGLNKYEEEEGMILDLSPEEIKQYTEGGYVIEDISVPSLNHMDEGGALNEFAGGGASSCPKDHVWDANTKKCVKVYTLANDQKFIDGGQPCPQGFQEDPVTGECVSIMGQTERVQRIQEVPTNQYSKYISAYEEANPRGMYVYQKKADYLRKYKGLNRSAGVTQDNFNTDVEGNFNRNWEYDRNSEVIKQFAKDHGINPKNHVELVEKIADKGDVSYDMIANSKYGSKLQPSLWARSLAGGQELGNFLVKSSLPGLLTSRGKDVFNKEIKGLTKKENKDIHESNFGALESLAWMDAPGAVIGNAISDASIASGGNYQESPGIFSGELKSNMDPLKAALLNPLNYLDLGLGMVAPARVGLKAASALSKVDDIVDVANIAKKANTAADEVKLVANAKRSQQLDGEAFSIYKGNKNVGEISGTRSSNGDFIVSDIGVDAQFQKQGIGTQAYKQLNESLAPGNKVKSWGAFVEDAGVAPGRNTWQNLEKQGLAKLNEKGTYEMLPKELPGSPNSEINWGAWNAEIPENKVLMQEYNAIEEASKANGTWMKNLDGSAFQGTPEQFVQQQSQNFKNAFGDIPPKISYRGDNTKNIQEFKSQYQQGRDYIKEKYNLRNENESHLVDKIWDKKKNILNTGIYTTDDYFAALKEYAKGDPEKVSFLYTKMNNPKISNTGESFQVLNTEKNKLISDGYDGLITPKSSFYPYGENVLFNSNQLKSAKGNNGMFDMTNPNIYKALIPAIGVGAASQIPQNKYGGLNKFIESGAIEKNMSKPEIKKLIAKGYVIEEI